MNLSKGLMLASMSLFFITSCSKDEDTLTKPQSENVSEFSDNNSDYSYGDIVQSVHNEDQANILSKNNTTFSSPWAEITGQDLSKLSTSTIKYTHLDFLKNRFTAVLNKGSRRPHSVSINSYQHGKGINPNSQQNWKAKIKTVGKRIKVKRSKKTKWKSASSTISYRNNTGKRKWMSYQGEMRYTDTKSTGWSIGGSVSLEVGGEVKVPLLAEASTKLTVSMNGERNGSKTISKTEVIRANVGRWVKPGNFINFAVIERHVNITTNWSIPVAFSGSVGADYGSKKFHGSHFKSVPASKFFYEYQNQHKKRQLNINEVSNKEYRVVAWTSKK